MANYGGNYQGWYLGIHSSGRVIFSVASPPANSPWLLSNSALALNTWYHVTATYDGGTRTGAIYVNGVQDAQATFPGFTPQSTVDLFLGRASWYDGYYLNAVLDEVRLLAIRQLPGEVLTDYQSFPGFTSHWSLPRLESDLLPDCLRQVFQDLLVLLENLPMLQKN